MSQDADTTIKLDEFAGQISNRGPHNIPANASQEQENIGTVKDGLLEVRGGLKRVTYDN